MGKIGHASIDENGGIAGGKVGDQTNKEICIREWYSKPWNIYLECTDKELANKAVSIMEQICGNRNYGYDQSQRTTGYVNIVKNNKEIDGAKGEFDCSSLVAACYILAGLTGLSINNTTRSLRAALINTGKFIYYTDSSHLLTDRLASPGGIYLKEGSHVVLYLGDPDKKIVKQESFIIHKVARGETLYKLASKYNVSVKDIATWNNITNLNLIHIGQELKIKK